MKLIAPEYYPDFRCIAGECGHTCCAGWEIDVDEGSLALYHRTQGEIGRRLRESICEEDDGAHFRLDEQERCPFLSRDGLCELILELGEDSLCQVCADHPRFRSFLSDRTEIGLGLCCEAACRLILTRKEPTRLMMLEDDGVEEELWTEDAEVLSAREQMLEIVQDRTKSMTDRVQTLCKQFGVCLPQRAWAQWAEALAGLERLDPTWDAHLAALRGFADDQRCDPAWETPLEQLMVYLIFRHVTPAAEDGQLSGRIAFVVFCWHLLRALGKAESADLPGFLELARCFSSEIEYSDENIAAIIGWLTA